MTTQSKGLDIAIRLESSLVGVENSLGTTQVQSQLATLTLQLHEIMKGKEVCQNI